MLASTWNWQVLAVLAGIFVVSVVVPQYLARKRAREFEQAVAQMGFAYQQQEVPVGQEELAFFRLFSQGWGKEFRNVARGSSPAGETVLFDYKYTVGGGRNSRTYYQTVALFRWPGASLPVFALALEHWWDKVGSAFGYQDIDFDSNPEFSKRFLLRGSDEAAIRQFFTPSVLGFLESRDASEEWTWEAEGDKLLIYTLDKKVSPAALALFLQQTASAASGLRSQSPLARTGF